MKKLNMIVFLTCAALPGLAAAESGGMMNGMSMDKMQGMHMKGEATANVHRGEGVVKRVDSANGSVTLAHQPIPSMSWPAMTMSFEVADKALLSRLAPGQQVNFEFREKAKGKYVITKVGQ